MDSVLDKLQMMKTMNIDWKLSAIGILVFSQLYFFITKTFMIPRKTSKKIVLSKGSNVMKTITTYVFPGTGITVSSSPFSTKLTMFCRLTGISHIVKEADMQKAPNGKVPYIMHDNNCIGDSQFILRYL